MEGGFILAGRDVAPSRSMDNSRLPNYGPFDVWCWCRDLISVLWHIISGLVERNFLIITALSYHNRLARCSFVFGFHLPHILNGVSKCLLLRYKPLSLLVIQSLPPSRAPCTLAKPYASRMLAALVVVVAVERQHRASNYYLIIVLFVS